MKQFLDKDFYYESLGKLAPEDAEGSIDLANSDTSARIAQLAQSLPQTWQKQSIMITQKTCRS